MKKIISIMLTLALLLSLAACSTLPNGDDEGDKKDDITTAATAVDVLNAVWEKYPDEEKFPVIGGDMSEENNNPEGPGVYSIADAEAIDAALGFPASEIGKIDNAASIVNMMNANSFTCGVYHLVNATDSKDVVAAIKENISTREWMCGFPDQLVIITVGEYVIAAYGLDDMMDNLKTHIAQSYADIYVECDEPIIV